MSAYMTVRYSPDGEWVTDNRGCATIEDAWNATDDGSRWFFYPIAVVIRDNGRGYVTDRQRIVDSPDLFSFLTGLTIGQAARALRAEPEYVAATLSL